MSERKNYQIVLFVFLMLMLNYFGKVVANYYSLPVWLDSIGTVIAAYVCDPFCGAVVGFTGNIIYGLQDPLALVYGLTSIAIGVSVGIVARKRLFDTLFGTLTASVIVTFFSVLISTPLNLLTNHGMIGNLWGDGVVSYLLERDVHPIVATVLGEFYVDFLDKVITLLVLYVAIKYVRFRRGHRADQAALFLLLVSAGILLHGTPAHAYEGDINNNIQTVYNSENGLPCGEANDVIQTNDGILWIGTYAGLYRCNGREFRWMSDYDSVRNVNCLYLDEEGRLWIGTNDNGLSIAINEKITRVIDEKQGLPANSVRCITQAANGNYYVGTTAGLQILTLGGGLDMVAQLPQITYAHSISADANGNVATVSNDGELFLVHDESVVDSLRLEAKQEIFSCVTFAGSGLLYAGTTSNQIYCYDVSAGKLQQKNVLSCEGLSAINRIYFTDDGTMYVCSDNGVGYMDARYTFHVINTGNFNNSIDNMAVDYQGNLWFASSRLGLLKLSRSPFADIYRSAGMTGKVVNAVAQWQGRLYVGTDSGLDIVDLDATQEIKDALTEQLDGVRIRCLRVDSDDNLWICTYGKGLLCVTRGGEITAFDSTNQTFGDWARVVIELSNGNIAASSDIGLGIFSKSTLERKSLYDEGLSKAMILCLVELPDGRLLCGSDGDGIAVIQNGEVTAHFSTADGLSSDVILRIVSDPVENGAYIVTSNGLCYMDATNRIRLLNEFPYFNNYDVWACEDGRLFVLSSGGIYVIHRDEILMPDGKPEYDLLDNKKGLKAALTANSWDYLDEQGNLYLASDTGVYRMNMDSYSVSRRSYRMMISSVFLDNEPHVIERGEPLTISRGVSRIEILPEVVNYTVDDPYVKYYLEGFDTMPTIVPQSELSSILYTNIPGGTYQFHLCILDGKSENVIEESVFELVKENEIYDTRWFHIYMLLVAMLAVSWLTWFIARTQIQRTINFQRKELEFAKNQLRMGNETIIAIAKTVDAKDEYTSLHSQRVSDYSVLIAKELGFSKDECENIRKVALLHDIGKIGIPDRVLNKAGRLTDEEYDIMKSHVTRGAEILRDFTVVEHAIEGALYHHERYDGRGYPQGLAGDAIPLYGRIICVADAFDAMTGNRIYRKRLDFSRVAEELHKGRGTQFDPQLIDILFRLIEEKKIDIDVLYGEKVDKGEPADKGETADMTGQDKGSDAQ